mmetsp:Transcript_42018/g.78599  ORF Transcript_42018/g.78599 Transcript_42018/m.78599 type:complete len:341 (-) Transcript_42018:73-1095(-)
MTEPGFDDESSHLRRKQHGLSFSLFNLPSLHVVGRSSAKATPQSATADGERSLGSQPGARRLNHQEVLTLGARMPFLIFVVIVALFTYGYHLNPIAPWFAVIICLDFAVLATWPPPSSMQPRTHWDWVPMTNCVFAVGAAVLCGLLNFCNIEAWVHVNFLQEFKDVVPTMSPASVSDAGVLNFAEGTVVDAGSAAGYRVWPYNYCAAPILVDDKESAPSSPVTFWAVGVGCCDSRGEFTCDSADDKEARKGIRLESHMLGYFMGHEVKENYEKAIRMAAAAYSMDAADDPILVAWHQDPESVGSRSWWSATIAFSLLVLVALCCCTSCQTTLTQVRLMQK